MTWTMELTGTVESWRKTKVFLQDSTVPAEDPRSAVCIRGRESVLKFCRLPFRWKVSMDIEFVDSYKSELRHLSKLLNKIRAPLFQTITVFQKRVVEASNFNMRYVQFPAGDPGRPRGIFVFRPKSIHHMSHYVLKLLKPCCCVRLRNSPPGLKCPWDIHADLSIY